jgi:hypothetical protein
MQITWEVAAVVASVCGCITTGVTLLYKFVIAALREAHESQDETIRSLLAALVGTSGAEPGLAHTALRQIGRLPPPVPPIDAGTSVGGQSKPVVTGVTMTRGD